MSKTKFLYSRDEEGHFNGECNSIEEAVSEAKKELELEEGDTFYIGQKVELDREWMGRMFNLIDIENINEAMEQEVGEVGEDWLERKDEDNLNDLLLDYLYKNHKPSFCLVDDIYEFTAKF